MAAEPRQSDIVTDLIQYIYDPRSEEVLLVQHRISIIVSQDCDLKWDYEARLKGEQAELNGVLLCEAEPWTDVKSRVGGRDIWKPLAQNKNERYQYLEEVPAWTDLTKEGLPALVVDFKKLFTVHATVLEHQLASGKARRRCRLRAPYCEHLQTRLAFYLQRVGIPEQHRFTTPPRL